MENTDLSSILATFVWAEVILIPILGALVWRLKEERKARDAEVKRLMKILHVVGVAKGRRF